MIKEKINKIKFTEIKWIKGYKTEIETHMQQQPKHIIRKHNKRARRTKKLINNKPSTRSIKFHRSYSFKRKEEFNLVR